MEISTLPPPPTTPHSLASYTLKPLTLQGTTGNDGIARFKKTKAAKAIRSILGMFQKPSRKKLENAKDGDLTTTPALTEETSIDSPSLKSSTDSAVTFTSGSETSSNTADSDFICVDGSPNNAMAIYSSDKLYEFDDALKDEMSKLGVEFNDADLCSDRMAKTAEVEDDDVFVNESYFEDDYFEDFSGDSSPEIINFPNLLSPRKDAIQRTESCSCGGQYTNYNKPVAGEFRFMGDFKSSRSRHSSMPCLRHIDLTDTEEIEDLALNIDHLLQPAAPYFTLGMDNMIPNHFGNNEQVDREVGEDKMQDESNDHKAESTPMSTELILGQSVENVMPVKENETCKTPVKQIYCSVKDGIQTPSTPCKKRQSENNYGRPLLKLDISSPNKHGQTFRKNIYKDKKPSSLKISNPDNANGYKSIADGLSSVADWVMQVVAINGPRTDKLAFSEPRNTNGRPLVKKNDPCLNTATPSSLQKIIGSDSSDNVVFSPAPPKTEEYISALRGIDRDKRLSVNEAPRFSVMDLRPRLESGYVSRSRCSTPATPLSEPMTPMTKLQSGMVMSPRSLNKLDGLTPPATSSFNQKNTKFMFHPGQPPPPVLITVPELSDSLCESSKKVEKSLHLNSENENDSGEVIISGGGDMESILTSPNNAGSTSGSSGSVFWSTPTTAPIRQTISIRVIDENNNEIQRPSPLNTQDTLPEITSPSIKKLFPISTSSPMHITSTNSLNPNSHSMKGKVVQRKPMEAGALAARTDPDGKCHPSTKKKMSRVKLNLPSPSEKKRKTSSRSARTARTCLRYEGRDYNNNEEEIENRPRVDYLMLKRVAKFVIGTIKHVEKFKSNLDVPNLMANLKSNYRRIIKESKAYEGIQSISQLKEIENKIKTLDLLSIETCIDRLLLNVLMENKEKTMASADYIFQNLSSVVRGNPSFLRLAPELIVLLLDNDHSIVKGPNGFPHPYKASEKEVLKAAVKYVEACQQDNPQNASRVQKLLYQVVDPSIVLNEVFPKLAKSDYKQKETFRVPKSSPPRVNHRISYLRSDAIVANDSDEENNLQNDRTTESNLCVMASSFCSAKPQDDRITLYELSKYGTINVEAPVDVRSICDEEHTLRTIYFCYGSFNGLPYIADIGMQYISKGKKKILFLASPFTQTTSSSRSHKAHKNSLFRDSKSFSKSSREKKHYEDSVDSPGKSSVYPVSERANPVSLKKVAVTLAPGEYVMAASVLASTDVHNIEMTTNTDRRIRVHQLATVSGMKWTRIQEPHQEGAPFCMHALIGETRTTPFEGTRLCRIGAVWAMTSWKANDLNR